MFRSYKNFDEDDFNQDLSRVPFHVAHTFDDIDDVYYVHETLLKEVINDHAPLKTKRPRKNPPPYMNSEYRKIIYKTRQAHNKFLKNKTPQNWKNYRKLRNDKENIKRTSIKNYFSERCGGGPKSKDFWSTIKPFFSSKLNSNTSEIILKDNSNIISDQTEVCNILNDFYINIANKNCY